MHVEAHEPGGERSIEAEVHRREQLGHRHEGLEGRARPAARLAVVGVGEGVVGQAVVEQLGVGAVLIRELDLRHHRRIEGGLDQRDCTGGRVHGELHLFAVVACAEAHAEPVAFLPVDLHGTPVLGAGERDVATNGRQSFGAVLEARRRLQAPPVGAVVILPVEARAPGGRDCPVQAERDGHARVLPGEDLLGAEIEGGVERGSAPERPEAIRGVQRSRVGECAVWIETLARELHLGLDEVDGRQPPRAAGSLGGQGRSQHTSEPVRLVAVDGLEAGLRTAGGREDDGPRPRETRGPVLGHGQENPAVGSQILPLDREALADGLGRVRNRLEGQPDRHRAAYREVPVVPEVKGMLDALGVPEEGEARGRPGAVIGHRVVGRAEAVQRGELGRRDADRLGGREDDRVRGATPCSVGGGQG